MCHCVVAKHGASERRARGGGGGAEGAHGQGAWVQPQACESMRVCVRACVRVVWGSQFFASPANIRVFDIPRGLSMMMISRVNLISNLISHRLPFSLYNFLCAFCFSYRFRVPPGTASTRGYVRVFIQFQSMAFNRSVNLLCTRVYFPPAPLTLSQSEVTWYLACRDAWRKITTAQDSQTLACRDNRQGVCRRDAETGHHVGEGLATLESQLEGALRVLPERLPPAVLAQPGAHRHRTV